jgi:hypothetical protein
MQSKEEQAIYLDKEFRNILFSKAYKNCGESLGSLAVEMGYARVKGRNGYVRDMWIGKVPVSRPKLQRLAELAGMTLEEILEHRVTKQQNEEIRDWTIAYKSFIRNLKKSANNEVRAPKRQHPFI